LLRDVRRGVCKRHRCDTYQTGGCGRMIPIMFANRCTSLQRKCCPSRLAQQFVMHCTDWTGTSAARSPSSSCAALGPPPLGAMATFLLSQPPSHSAYHGGVAFGVPPSLCVVLCDARLVPCLCTVCVGEVSSRVAHPRHSVSRQPGGHLRRGLRGRQAGTPCCSPISISLAPPPTSRAETVHVRVGDGACAGLVLPPS